MNLNPHYVPELIHALTSRRAANSISTPTFEFALPHPVSESYRDTRSSSPALAFFQDRLTQWRERDAVVAGTAG